MTKIEDHIAEHDGDDWNFEDLDGQGFYELMQMYRHSPITEIKATVAAFELVKEYIRWWSKTKGEEDGQQSSIG